MKTGITPFLKEEIKYLCLPTKEKLKDTYWQASKLL